MWYFKTRDRDEGKRPFYSSIAVTVDGLSWKMKPQESEIMGSKLGGCRNENGMITLLDARLISRVRIAIVRLIEGAIKQCNINYKMLDRFLILYSFLYKSKIIKLTYIVFQHSTNK